MGWLTPAIGGQLPSRREMEVCVTWKGWRGIAPGIAGARSLALSTRLRRELRAVGQCHGTQRRPHPAPPSVIVRRPGSPLSLRYRVFFFLVCRGPPAWARCTCFYICSIQLPGAMTLFVHRRRWGDAALIPGTPSALHRRDNHAGFSFASDAGRRGVAGRMGTERGKTVRTLDKAPWVRTGHHSGR